MYIFIYIYIYIYFFLWITLLLKYIFVYYYCAAQKDIMIAFVSRKKEPLTIEERTLFSVSFKNVVILLLRR